MPWVQVSSRVLRQVISASSPRQMQVNMPMRKSTAGAHSAATIAVGFDADRDLLARLARLGRGRGYVADSAAELPRLTQYRMFALGVIPEYHGKAIDSLLYRALYEAVFSPTMRMEINYVLEDNAPMNNAILKLGASPLRRYRVYEMAI